MLALLNGCANIVPPEGGKKDETAPVLLSVVPSDSSLNIRPKKIELYFNEYIDIHDLDKNLALSPLMQITPSVLSYGKRVEIKILDTQLLANTTYRINLGDALTDNHEANPYRDFVYMFSTGAYFDSLELRGQVVDAATGMADSSMLITLYNTTENDTAVMAKKPLYAVRADASGSFLFRSLPLKSFRIYAIQDANNNYIYDPGEEKIGFIDRVVVPSLQKDSTVVFNMFREKRDTVKTETDTAATIVPPRRPGKVAYLVQVDTSNPAERTFELDKELSVDLYRELKSLDSAKIYLSYENNGIEVEAVQKLRVDSAGIKISTQWQPDKKYTLRLVKGWARDTTGAELPPGKYFFRTKREEDYGKLKIHVDGRYFGDSILLYIFKDNNDSIYLKPVTDSIISISLLPPGNYDMRLIVDANRNGHWDPGNLLLRRQPERVLPYATTIRLKAGWENEIDFIPDSNAGKKRPREAGNRPGAATPQNSSPDRSKPRQ
ncbi:Ig-like domain-containing protein [Taibaiella koreensis]|uniref:Ig-like domain-containing protein n=1 Tax=Taibaiella koreensis TaxID=1268548 RepID=UPI0013C2E55F|nr:Ig-like domain-containing protein [Taibaiella koreensis]